MERKRGYSYSIELDVLINLVLEDCHIELL